MFALRGSGPSTSDLVILALSHFEFALGFGASLLPGYLLVLPLGGSSVWVRGLLLGVENYVYQHCENEKNCRDVIKIQRQLKLREALDLGQA